jgi:hypothetical protein
LAFLEMLATAGGLQVGEELEIGGGVLLGLFVDRAQQRAKSRAEHGVAGAGLVGPAVAHVRRLVERASQQGVQPLALAIIHDRLPVRGLLLSPTAGTPIARETVTAPRRTSGGAGR